MKKAWAHVELQKNLRKLEAVATALDRDRSDRRHGSLHDSFQEFIAENKQEDILSIPAALEKEILDVKGLIYYRRSIPALLQTTDFIYF